MKRHVFLTASLAAIVIAAVLFARQSQPADPGFDLLIRHARIVDGSGSPWYRGDVAVRGDTIVRIAPSIEAPDGVSGGGVGSGGTAGVRVIDAQGQVLAPGFIDIHTHARRGIFQVPTADNYVRQGVTTVIEGPDGSSPLPLQEFLAKLDALRISVNIGSFAGQGAIREAVMGEVDRAPTPDEIERMRRIVEREMRAGAFGLSSGLFYVPGNFSSTAEVTELAKVAGRHGGIYISHMRDEASKVVDSVAETIAIGEQGGLPTQVTHHKVVGTANWGRSVETLRLVDEARTRGVDATIDQYPYTASATSVQAALLPAWALEGGRQRVLARLRDPATRARIRAETVRIIRDERGGGDPKNVQLARCDWQPSLAGKTLADVTRDRGQDPSFEQAAETAFWIVERGGCQGVFHAIGEDDLARILRHPATMIASDGEVPVFGQNVPHPRSYGTFARVLGVYVREKRVLTLEDAVRKMSAFPAQRLSLTDRGLVRPGLRADLVLFDPSRVRDLATYQRPHQYAEGVSVVVVNGQIVYEKGAMTDARPGRVLYGPARPAATPSRTPRGEVMSPQAHTKQDGLAKR